MSRESTLENLRRHVNNWSSHNQNSVNDVFKDISEEQVSEAVAFFKNRNPNVITGMIALLEHIGTYSS